MALEELVVGFIGAINRLANAIEKSTQEPQVSVAPLAPEAEPEPTEVRRRPGRPRAAEKTNGEDTAGPTHDDALEIAVKLAEKYDKAVVAQLVRQHTGSGMKIADLPKNKIQAFIASCEVMLAGRGEATSDL